MLIFITLLTLILVILSFILTEKKPNKEKCFIFECGFNPISKIGIPFSIKFFIIAILFLVFDLEVVLLFPFFIILYSINSIYYYYSFLIFITILIVGLIFEWYNGGLEWD